MKKYSEEMVQRAIFSDTTEEYVTPVEPKEGDRVTVKIRVLKGHVKGVDLVADSGIITMNKGKHKGCFEYYEASFLMKDITFSYYFEIKTDDNTYLYDGRGLVNKEDDRYKFRLIPGFSTPDWAKGAVFYQIYVDRFCNGDETNDVINNEYRYIDRLTYKSEWGAPVAVDGIGQFYGGDLKGVMDKLDYLKDLGVEVIYFNPLFVSPSNHKYDTADYDYIDPHFGVIADDSGDVLPDNATSNEKATKYKNRVTNEKNLNASNELFASLVAAAHERGIKVILDGVFNHCGSFNKWMDTEKIYSNESAYEKGAFVDKNSPYHDYFEFTEDKWPDNSSYKAWWDFDTLPKLNYANKELYDYILKIGAKWVSEPFNCDGWRLDVAADLGNDAAMNHRFWADFRKSVKAANPEAIILAEHYGDPSSYLEGNQWDTVMNYDAFMEPVTWFTTGMEKHSDEYREELVGNTNEFWKMMRENSARFTTSSLQTAMNELSNHDHSRFLTRTSHKVGRLKDKGAEAAGLNVSSSVMRDAVMMQMTWPGAPTVYYGDEAGLAGFTDPDCRRCYPWGSEDMDMLAFHKAVIGIHKQNNELKKGSLIPLPTANGIIAYARKLGKEVILVAVSMYEVGIETKIPTWMADASGKVVRLLETSDNGWSEKKKIFKEKDGMTRVSIGPHGAIICKIK